MPSPSAVPGICCEKCEECVEVTGGCRSRQFELLSGPRSCPPAHSVTLAEDKWIGTADCTEQLGTARFGGRVAQLLLFLHRWSRPQTPEKPWSESPNREGEHLHSTQLAVGLAVTEA